MPALASPVNKALVLRGISTAAFPQLVGRVLHEREESVLLPAAVETPATVGLRVVRSNATGLLNFEYRLTLTEVDYDEAIRLSVGFSQYGVAVTFADFRADGPGVQPPNYFESAPPELAAFRFDYGIAVKKPSRSCVIGTNAREWKETGGTLKLVLGKKSVSVDVPSPTAVAAVNFRSSPLPMEAELVADTEGEA